MAMMDKQSFWSLDEKKEGFGGMRVRIGIWGVGGML